ncbi:MAG: hypothetical protein L0H41_07025 [Microlunatus sp.]|nr:hypothetical protein [Microlunatus sp.]MDN5769898.1 hypothetical protein [Microlunatus sp.]MDN5804156.1 hypothetical protein [Microlunatus sp.]
MSEPPYAPQQRPRPPQSYPAQPYPAQAYPPQGRPPAQPPSRPHPQHGSRRRPDAETTSQVQAALAARAELGPEYDEHIAAGLADRVEELVAYRTAELRHAGEQTREDRGDRRSRETHRFVLGIISLGSGIPITAIAATSVDPGLLGVVASWAGIVGVNVVFAWGNRRTRDK